MSQTRLLVILVVGAAAVGALLVARFAAPDGWLASTAQCLLTDCEEVQRDCYNERGMPVPAWQCEERGWNPFARRSRVIPPAPASANPARGPAVQPVQRRRVRQVAARCLKTASAVVRDGVASGAVMSSDAGRQWSRKAREPTVYPSTVCRQLSRLLQPALVPGSVAAHRYENAECRAYRQSWIRAVVARSPLRLATGEAVHAAGSDPKMRLVASTPPWTPRAWTVTPEGPTGWATDGDPYGRAIRLHGATSKSEAWVGIPVGELSEAQRAGLELIYCRHHRQRSCTDIDEQPAKKTCQVQWAHPRFFDSDTAYFELTRLETRVSMQPILTTPATRHSGGGTVF